MHRQRHHARILRALGVEPIELVLAALEPLRGGVMLDDHHGDVVELERIRHGDDRSRGGADLVGLVVVHPVGDVLDPLGGQMIQRLPGLGEAGAEPAPGRFPGELPQHLDGLADGRALIGEEVQGALDHAVGHELPARVQHRARHRLVGLDDVRVDGGGGADLPLGERLQQPPEAHAHSVVVPGPVGHVRHRGHALRRGEVLPRHRFLDVPLLDVHDGPHRDAGAAGQLPRAAVGDGRVVEAVARESHGERLPPRGV